MRRKVDSDLEAAIKRAPCLYCMAEPNKPCHTFKGTKTDYHLERVDAGHTILKAQGREHPDRQPQTTRGHVRRHYQGRRERAGLE